MNRSIPARAAFLGILPILVLILVMSCAGGAEPLPGEGPAAPRETEEDVTPPETAAVPGTSGETTEAKSTAGVRGYVSTDDDSKKYDYMDEEPAAASSEALPSAASGTSGSSMPGASGLKAGYADDNRQYGYFIEFLEEYGYVDHYPLNVSERIVLEVTDSDGKSIPSARVTIRSEGQALVRGLTVADGTYQFNPSEYSGRYTDYTAAVNVGTRSLELSFPRDGERRIELSFDVPRRITEPIPLDVLFIMDTTGSMGEEIERLRTTIEIIHLNLTSLPVPILVRFGMVLYKDRGDEYRTKYVPLTADLDEFRSALSLVEASGGGDTPEDLQAALETAAREAAWNADGIRLAFIITDAPPHLDYGQKYTYAQAARDARAGGIKIFTVGTGGLDVTGEYVLRQISQYTQAKYIFLTYGETGESEGGTPGSVSHHTGANFQTDKLEAIIIRFAKEELGHLTDAPLVVEEPYFTASKIENEEREETLNALFGMALGQLADFSTIGIERGTPTAILPLVTAEESLALNAEYLSEQLVLSAAKSESFRLVERKDMNKIFEELKLRLSGITEGDGATEVGKALNAELLVVGTLYRRESYELFLKLLRVETGEVLSVTKAVIDLRLGL